MNGDSDRKFGWPHLRDLIVIVAVAAGGGLAYNTNDQASQIKEDIARVDERLLAHQGNHPDTGLQRQIDTINRQIESLQRRIREMELEHRTERYTTE